MPKILIVEDNEENRDSLSRRLQRRGYEVVAAADGKAGVAMAQAEKPDLILMDMNMPERGRLGSHAADQGHRRSCKTWASSRSRRMRWPGTRSALCRPAAPTTTRSPSISRSCWPRWRPSCKSDRRTRRDPEVPYPPMPFRAITPCSPDSSLLPAWHRSPVFYGLEKKVPTLS